MTSAGVIRKPADLIAGCLFAVLGIAFVVLAQDYDFGTARRMGPGYFPTLLGAVLAVLGLAIAAGSLVGARQAAERVAVRPLALVALGIVLFGFLVRSVGLVPAVAVLVIVAVLAGERFRWTTALTLAAALAAFCWATFTWALGLPIPAFAPAFTDWIGG